jgi:hypothetical protein
MFAGEGNGSKLTPKLFDKALPAKIYFPEADNANFGINDVEIVTSLHVFPKLVDILFKIALQFIIITCPDFDIPITLKASLPRSVVLIVIGLYVSPKLDDN